MQTPETQAEQLHAQVRQRYGARALNVLSPSSGCCGADGCGDRGADLYSSEEVQRVPELALRASLGCGNPTAIAQLTPGDVVLDLGSGGGIDVLLAADRVGPSGFVYGLDMTDEMLELAERNRQTKGVSNARFLKGHIEEIPLPDGAVDVVISNCVINLAADKAQVLREAFRVLKPGGRFSVADVVLLGPPSDTLRRDMEAWVGCVAGALEAQEYRRLLEAAGFVDVEVEVAHRYDAEQIGGSGCCGSGVATTPEQVGVASALVRARKPTIL